MTKILGYTNGEISRLYILSTSFVVVFCLLLSLPVERQIMEVLFREMMLSSISGWITMWVDPMIYVKMTAIGIAAYAVVAVLEFRRIRHVPMDEALKKCGIICDICIYIRKNNSGYPKILQNMQQDQEYVWFN